MLGGEERRRGDGKFVMGGGDVHGQWLAPLAPVHAPPPSRHGRSPTRSHVRPACRYKACASYDYATWFRVQDTAYDAERGHLTMSLRPEHGSVYFAYFPPYTQHRHLSLLGSLAVSSPHLVSCSVVGQSLQGRDIDLVSVGAGADGPWTRSASAAEGGPLRRAVVWVIARQHPGECMAQHAAEGLLARLASGVDARSDVLLDRAIVHCIPNMNPDGSILGHMRTNALGANLNREWEKPTLDYSPEVRGWRCGGREEREDGVGKQCVEEGARGKRRRRRA